MLWDFLIIIIDYMCNKRLKKEPIWKIRHSLTLLPIYMSFTCFNSICLVLFLKLDFLELSASIVLNLIFGCQRMQWHPTPVLLPGKSHGRRSLVGCSPWGHEESDTTERLHFHLSLSCIGEGNGNPLQCSCLENPRDRGAWWAAIYGVTQSRTGLMWLSSSIFGCEHIFYYCVRILQRNR